MIVFKPNKHITEFDASQIPANAPAPLTPPSKIVSET